MQTYQTYFKREFDKKRENSGVLARFVLFLSGIADIGERMADVRRRYGSYPQSQWDKNLELKSYFENLIGENIYAFLGDERER